jgi:hypothetical protein
MRETLRQAQGVPGLRAVLGRWNVRYLIARKPTATSHASPAALRVLLDECTLAEYIFDDFYVARVEPVCRADATQPVEPIVTAAPGIYDDLDPAILLRGDWVRSNEFDRTFLHTVSYTDAPGAEVRFAFRGTSLRYVFTRAANRGIAAIAIDGTSYGSLDLYAPQPEWQSSATFEHLGPGRHLLVIRVTGESRPAATGTFVDLDGLEVR